MPERELVERCWAVYAKGPPYDDVLLRVMGEDLYEYVTAEYEPCPPKDRKHKTAKLGGGAFGVTYRMRRKADSQLFAVKQINKRQARRLRVNPESLLHEAKLLQGVGYRQRCHRLSLSR